MPSAKGVVAHAIDRREAASSRWVSARSGERRHREGAQRPDHLGDATGIVTEDLAVLLEPAGGATAWSDAVCRCSQACQKSITSVSGDRVPGRSSCRQAPSAIATIPISGRLGLMCATSLEAAPSACSLPLPACGRDRGSSGACPRRRGRRPCRRQPRARRPWRDRLAGSQRHHDAVEGDRERWSRPRSPSASRMLPSVGPRLSQHRACSGSGAAGCSPTAAWRRSSQRTPPLPGPCSDPSSADRARPPAASGNRRRGPGSRRPAPAMPRGAAAVTRSPVGRTERGHDRRRHRDPEPARPSRSIREAPSSRFSMTAPMTSRANSFVASRTRNSTSSTPRARGSERSSATQCEHPGGRLDDPEAGRTRWEGAGGGDSGNAPDVGFQDTAS